MKHVIRWCLMISTAILLCGCSKHHTHEFSDWKNITDASDSEKIIKERECSCGEKETKVVPTKEDEKETETDKALVSTKKELSESKNKDNAVQKETAPLDSANDIKSHSYTSKVTTPATCTTTGVMTHICKNCSDSYITVIPVIGHNYTSAVTTPATSTSTGIKTYTCQNCADTYTVVIPSTGEEKPTESESQTESETPTESENPSEDQEPPKDQNIEDIKAAINATYKYLEEKEFGSNLFSNVLQCKLNHSLVYNVDEDEYLIIYNNLYFSYKEHELNKLDCLEYSIFNNVEEALKDGSVGMKILTKGYYTEYDGGNAYFSIENYNANDKICSISNADKTISLNYITYDSVINILQMGYKSGETIDGYVNQFTKKLEYNSIFVPKGEYKVVDCFDINVSNKAYYGYDVKIYSDDTYTPEGNNKGCMFYVYNNIQNIHINGFDVKIFINEPLEKPLMGLLTARDVDGLILNNCSFYLPKEGSMYPSSGMIDLFTGWKNVVIKNCHLENHSSTVGGGGIGFRDIYKKGCENALFENNYVYSNCKDEVIAIFSGGDTSLYPNETGGGYIDNVILKNNTIIGGKPNEDIGPRVVGLTVGYQLSPVSNIKFIGNQIKMYSANYLLIYGKTDTLTLERNNIQIDSSYREKLYVLFWHNVYADAGKNITIDNNSIEMLDDSTLLTIAQTGEEFKFINNTLNCPSTVERVFDSQSSYENNVFNIGTVSGCIYHDIKEVKNNKIHAGYLNTVYEFYNLNMQNDITIDSDQIETESIGANFMMFNGWNIKFNNHAVNFKNLTFKTDSVGSPYYYLAYDTSAIQDHANINFIQSDLSVYEAPGHNYVAKDEKGKVSINYTD